MPVLLLLPPLLLMSACKDAAAPSTGDDTDPGAALDLTAPLGEGEARAGVVTDESALFGGVSAEGQLGDVKIYNSRVRFIVQADRPSSYYIDYGGGVIDADIARPEGEPGRDMLDEFAVMAGLGRLLVPETITVVSDGTDGSPAEVLVRGRGGPMALLTASVENDAIIPDYDVEMTVCYRLAPDSDLLEVETTVRWMDETTSIQLGGLAMLSDDVSAPYHPGAGLEEPDSTPAWLGVIADRGELALAIFPEEQAFTGSALQQLLSSIGPVLSGFDENTLVEDGDVLTWRAYLGVGADLAALSGAWLERTGQTAEALSGQVTADGAPLAGARVHLLDADGAPVTLAQTDAEGRFSATVPAGAVTAAVATGRGQAQHYEQPAIAPWYSPLAASAVRDASLAAAQADALAPLPFAEGYGISAQQPITAGEDVALELTPPGTLTVEVTDGLPAVVQVAFAAAGDPAAGADRRLVPGRPGGYAAQAWLIAGDIPLEPGDYVVTLHRGLRYEPTLTEVTVRSGEAVTVSDAPVLSYAPEGVMVLDPHSHAAPSVDGEIPMSERLLGQAANGIDVHFGTDHDNVADYRVLLEPLGLSGVLTSVVADEFSPVLRGHINVYPLEAIPEANGGALLWWAQRQDTPEWFAALRDEVGDGVLQVNHPMSSGLVDAAQYELGTGVIRRPDFWSSDFDAIEVINDGDYAEPFAFYLDMIGRGLEPTPVGVSDSHGHRGVGSSVTFMPLGEYSDDALVERMRAHATVATTGPYIEATAPDGAWAPGRTLSGPTTLSVAVYAPSWVPVDRLLLYRDGEVIEEIPATGEPPLRVEAELALAPEADAAYVLVASGDERMSAVYPGEPSWAMAAAVRIDAEGDGWQPPWPAISE